jgi:hypothetical protein
MSSITVSILIGLSILFFVSSLIQQRTLDRWTRDTGRAPMIHKGRGSWHAYLRSVKAEMPASVNRRIAFWGWVAKVSLMLAMTIIALYPVLHRH